MTPRFSRILRHSLLPLFLFVGIVLGSVVVNYANAQPPTGVPGTGVPGTGVPGTGVPGTGVPGTGVPGTGVPGTGVPGTGVPGTGGGGACGAKFCNPLAFNTLEDFLRAILSAVIMIAFPILVLFMVYAGFKFVAAQGKPEEIAKARRIFLWTLVGALIILGAQALSYAIEETINALQ